MMRGLNDCAPQEAAVWPSWLDARRVDDALAALAYDSVSPACRGAIKTGIALAYFHFGQPTGIADEVYVQPHAGFSRAMQICPQQWTLIVFEPEFKQAALLCAAAMLPLLADVRLVGAICLNGVPGPQALLTLELCGIEDIFILDAQEISGLIAGLGSDGSLIHFCQPARLAESLEYATQMGAAIYCHSLAPNVELLDDAAFNLETLEFCLGALPGQPQNSRPVDAIYASVETAGKLWRDSHFFGNNRPRLCITPGCEGFWAFKNLSPNCFKSQRLAFQFI